MLKYHTIDISCRVIPNEVSLVVNITGCTIKCPGCNERTLWKDKGIALTIKELRSILQNYSSSITCVCFMGGEHEPEEINMLARFVKHNYSCLRTAWYSGLDEISKEIDFCNFNYLKIGAYQAFKGALGTVGTNQRVFEVTEDYALIDIKDKYIRTEPDEVRQLDDVQKHDEIVDAPQEDDENANITDDIDQSPDTDNIEDVVAEQEPDQPIDSQDDYQDKEDTAQPINPVHNNSTPPDGIIMEI